MSKKVRLRRGKSLLFVCYGNTCSSPMAEGLARRRLGTSVSLGSAGLSPYHFGAQREAVRVMEELFGVDISGHVTRSLSEIELEEFDWIFVLDGFVYEHLRRHLPEIRSRLVAWPIDDPFGQNLEAYRDSGKTLARLFDKKLIPPAST